MNRKQFLAAIPPLTVALGAFGNHSTHEPDGATEGSKKRFTIPPYLRPGDTIGINCAASYSTLEEVQSALAKLKEWGFGVEIGKSVGAKDFTFGGTDAERAADMQYMLDNPNIKAILGARGGYGTVRIIDQLDFKKFAKKPKWIIGFSDSTVFHCHLHRHHHIATLHSKMCNSFLQDWTKAEPTQLESIEAIRLALTGEKMKYTTPAHEKNRAGQAEGVLIGGNLSIIYNMTGTSSDINCDGKILFLEDVGEYLYSVDRMFYNLLRTGKLSKLKGLIIGGFSEPAPRPDKPREDFGRTLYDIVWEKVKDFNYPVCFDFPVGHQKHNVPLKCGVRHRLEVNGEGAVLSEL
jgi:muramoyltetrapeptide carboxypeptidase